MSKNIFFNDWEHVIRIIVVGVLSYFALIILLRISGKRTLSRMNTYDIVITMALGSILANVLLTSDVGVTESVASMAVLIFLQYFMSILAFHFPKLGDFISGKQVVLYEKGHYVEKALHHEHIRKEEIKGAISEEGLGDITDVDKIILESNGEICVIAKNKQPHKTKQANLKI